MRRAKLAIMKADRHSNFKQFLVVAVRTCGTNSGTTTSLEVESQVPNAYIIQLCMHYHAPLIPILSMSW